MKKLTLVVCDVQPDVIKKIPNSQQFVDLVDLAVRAGRNSKTTAAVDIVHTMIRFPESSYDCIPLSHPKLGILRKLQMKNSPISWFTSPELSIPVAEDDPKEIVLNRTTYLPHANDRKLLEALNYENQESLKDRDFIVIGYGPTVQAVCHILGDVIGTPNVHILKECVQDENMERCKAFLDHGLLFKEEVASLVDFIECKSLVLLCYPNLWSIATSKSKSPHSHCPSSFFYSDLLEAMDLLQERFDDLPSSQKEKSQTSQKYVCDCDRGGHISLYMFYLLRDHGYVKWPRQPWFQDLTRNGKQYWCPVGRRSIDLCDEPQFGSSTRFFLTGREWLDEKDKLHELVPELMPPTFHSLNEAQKYSDTILESTGSRPFIWFLKKVNQNGGRAVEVRHNLPPQQLESDEQLQAHVPRPLLFPKPSLSDGKERPHKCHVKTYQWIGCTTDPVTDIISWQLYMHDLYYLATADKPFDPNDLTDQVQITTMRTHRLYSDHPWRIQWGLEEKIRERIETVLRRAIEQGKLQWNLPSTEENGNTKGKYALQFEVNSADWMLDEDGNMFLIECNGIPVLYVPEIKQPLITRGLNLYDGLYKKDPKGACVDDTDLVREAIGLALTGKLPKKTLWKHIATFPCP